MRFENIEAPAYSGSAGANGKPAMTEELRLVDRDGTVLKTFTKDAAGDFTETTRITASAPIARVVVGTIDSALAGSPALLQFGDLYITTVAEGAGIPDDDDGTELIPYLQTNAALIPADHVVDNEDGTFDIVCHPGAAGNGINFISADANLTFDDDVEGADAVVESLAPVFNGGNAAVFLNLPTTDPEVAGQLWADTGGVVTVSAGPQE